MNFPARLVRTLPVLACLASPLIAQQQRLELTASDATVADRFGYAVAINGTRAYVGARSADPAGAVYVIDLPSGQELSKLTVFAGGSFGTSVAVTDDYLVVGANTDDKNGTNSGAAHIFDTTTGQKLHKLLASDGASFDWFGSTVAVSGDRVIVGANGNDDHGNNSGSAYVFDAVTGQELYKLTASDAGAEAEFGWSVAMSDDRMLIGARRDDNNTGAAYLFDVATGQELAKWTASDGVAGDFLGQSVAIDGALAIVGAQLSDSAAVESGAAYVFDVATGQELHKLVASNGATADGFGFAASISGEVAVVGSFAADGPAGADTGAAYVYDLTSGQELHMLTSSDAALGDLFGNAVAIDGARVLVGAKAHEAHAGWYSGAAYFFGLPIGTGYCGPAVPNSGGQPAMIGATGSTLVSHGDLELSADQLPQNQFSYFVTSQTQGLVTPPGSQGNLCLSGQIGRFSKDVLNTGAAGEVSLQIDLTDIPIGGGVAVQPGETWNFQLWFRDQNPGTTSNFTDAVAITFE